VRPNLLIYWQTTVEDLLAFTRMSRRFTFFVLIAMFAQGVRVMAADGLTTIASSYSPTETVKRLEAAIQARGMIVFATVDHAAAAKEVGLDLRPTLVMIFGAARGGTSLMQAEQTVGIDLPLKALIWQDAAGKTWISYNEPEWIAKRHSLGDGVKPVVEKLHEVLIAVVDEAAGVK
jgi:uncharacterized protein (DUF302 family)